MPRALDALALFREHADFVARFLVRLGAQRSEVDDLVQEVFLVVHKEGGYVPGTGRPTTWLAAIALYKMRSVRRLKRGDRIDLDQESVDMAVDEGAGPSEAIESAEADERVRSALTTLDTDHRAVLVLYEMEGCSCASIAEGLGIPIGTVYSRLNTGRRRFREAYARNELAAQPRSRKEEK